MTQIDQAKALDLMKRMKDDVRETINKYATESSELPLSTTVTSIFKCVLSKQNFLTDSKQVATNLGVL
jgi:hypothetical protein